MYSSTPSTEVAKFAGRVEAGSLLASLLTTYGTRNDAVLIGIPRGGVPVAIEVARILRRPLDTLVVEKIRVPVHAAWQATQSIGAVAASGVRALDLNHIDSLRIPSQEVEQAARIAQNDQAHKEELYRRLREPLSIRGRTVILVDDAIDSGATMHAAIQAVRRERPAGIIVAAPVGSAAACRFLGTLTDHVVCPVQPCEGAAVHECYARFPPISDSEAYAMLERSLNRPVRT